MSYKYCLQLIRIYRREGFTGICDALIANRTKKNDTLW